jgi:quercetin dioxygenase-like cupin family protein
VGLTFFPRLGSVGYAVIHADELEWETRPSDPGEAERHVAGLTDRAGFQHTRANLWRYEPGAKGRRHRDTIQEETFVVVRGTLTMYLGEPPERQQVGQGGLIHVESGTPLQVVNESGEDLFLYIFGAPPEHGGAEFLDPAV